MPRYFFDTLVGDGCDPDPEGLDLADDAAAIGMAWISLWEELAGVVRPAQCRLSVVVRDEARRPIYEVMVGGNPLQHPETRLAP